MDVQLVLAKISSFQCNTVCVTGGEPLAQPECLALLTQLCNTDFKVSLETGNAIDISSVDPRVYIVLDIKTPGSGEELNNRYRNLTALKSTDAIKYVICSRSDYQWAKTQVIQKRLFEKHEIFFSPEAEQQSATALADWIIEDRLQVSMQIQMHKVLWAESKGR